MWVYVCVGFLICGCFGNMCTRIYSVFIACNVFCIVSFMYILISLVCTSLRTTATEGQISCSYL